MAPLVHIDRMPDELFTRALSLLHIFEIARAMGVSRAWRSAILHTPALWARLDLREAHYLGLQYLPLLLARSVEAPLDLAFEDHGDIGLPPAGQLQATLAPVLHRIRSLEFHAPDINIYLPIFELLRGHASLLTSLDLASTGWFAIQIMRGDLPAHDEHLVHLAQQLRFLDCGEHVLPLETTVFPNVRHLRIAVSTRDSEAVEHLFSQFPSMTTLRIYRNFAELPELPEYHPLRRLEIFAKPDLYGDVPPDLHLRALGFLRVAELEIRGFTFSVLAEISKGPEWTARSARLDAGNLFDASFDSVSVSGTRTCCMSGLSLSNATHQLEAQKLMYRNAFWRSVTELTISSIKRPPREQSVAPLLFPVVRTPELTTLTTLFELPAPSNAGLNWAVPGRKRYSRRTSRPRSAFCALTRCARSALLRSSQTRAGTRRPSPVPSPKPHSPTLSCATYSLEQRD